MEGAEAQKVTRGKCARNNGVGGSRGVVVRMPRSVRNRVREEKAVVSAVPTGSRQPLWGRCAGATGSTGGERGRCSLTRPAVLVLVRSVAPRWRA